MSEDIRKDITKQEAARRQIETAIRMNFMDDDAISIHVLASSAEVIVSDICHKRSRATVRDRFEEYIKPEFTTEWRQLMKAAYNYFKHADRDTEVELPHFDERINDAIIWFAITDYRTAFGRITPLMALYVSWFIATKPHFAAPNYPNIDQIKRLLSNIHEQSRQVQKLRGRELLDLLADVLPQLERIMTTEAQET